MKSDAPLLIFDSMLGDVSKWMRILGIKVEFYRDVTDDELLKIARTKNGFLITRDRELSKRDQRVYLLKSSSLWDSLKEIIDEFSLKNFISPFRYCPVCGEELVEVEKEFARFFIPGYVYFENEKIRYCKKCKKFYWKGDKFKNILKLIQNHRL